jgi:hypothetical protein
MRQAGSHASERRGPRGEGTKCEGAKACLTLADTSDAIRETVARGRGYVAGYKGNVNRKIDEIDVNTTRTILEFAGKARENCTNFKELVMATRRSL